ncbi:hypothetical protein [Mycobacterium phage BK1]|nr:hypothetical protein [Mycobacterium phage BK1]BBC43812.1 hypothetical protein [Mycobacterium phage A6]
MITETSAYQLAKSFVTTHRVRNVADAFVLNYAHDTRGLTPRDYHRTYWGPLQMRRLANGMGLS